VASEIQEGTPEQLTVIVEPGDSLAHFALWAGRTESDLVAANSPNHSRRFVVGKPFNLKLTRAEARVFMLRRSSHHQLLRE
jgi:hypothetical protein